MEIRLEFWEGFFFSFDLEKGIWGTLAGRKANEARDSEKQPLPHSFPGTHRFESFEEKSQFVFYPACLRAT